MLLVGGVRASERAFSESEQGCALSQARATAFAERLDAIFDGPTLEIADEIFAPDFVSHLPLAPELDREGWMNHVASFYAGVPDLTEAVNQVVVDDDGVVLHVTYTGTHEGPLLGVPPTGRSLTMEGIGIFRFDEDCLARENWAVLDVVGVLAEIGAFSPATAQDDTSALNEQSEAYRESLFRIIDEGITPGKFDLVTEGLAEDYVVHSPLGELDGEDVVAFFSALRASMSDFSVVRNQVIVEGQFAAARGTIRGTFDAAEFPSPFGVLQPNDQPVDVDFVNIFRFNEEGR